MKGKKNLKKNQMRKHSLTKSKNCKTADKNFPILLQIGYNTANKKLVCLFVPIKQVMPLPELTEMLQCFIC